MKSKKELAFEAKIERIIQEKKKLAAQNKKIKKQEKEIAEIIKAKENEEAVKIGKTIIELAKKDFAGITTITELKAVLKMNQETEQEVKQIVNQIIDEELKI